MIQLVVRVDHRMAAGGRGQTMCACGGPDPILRTGSSCTLRATLSNLDGVPHGLEHHGRSGHGNGGIRIMQEMFGLITAASLALPRTVGRRSVDD
jgi:hypothetical protein